MTADDCNRPEPEPAPDPLPDPAGVRIDDALVRFLEDGVSISVGSCGAARVPNLSRALGCRVAADRCCVRVFVASAASAALLDDVTANGALAVVYSQPSTHRTVQLKARDARIAALAAGDRDCVARYRAAFVAGLAALGYPAEVMGMLVACADEELVAIEFTPIAAYVQTPGPAAGAALDTAPDGAS